MWRVAVLMALGLAPAAVPAVALTPPLPTCLSAHLAPAERGNDGYDYLTVSDTLVTYRLTLEGPRRVDYVVEHCRSRDRVTATILWSDPPTQAQWAAYGEANTVIWNAISTDRTVTFRGLEQLLRAQGIDTRRHRADYVSCACAGMRATAGTNGGGN